MQLEMIIPFLWTFPVLYLPFLVPTNFRGSTQDFNPVIEDSSSLSCQHFHYIYIHHFYLQFLLPKLVTILRKWHPCTAQWSYVSQFCNFNLQFLDWHCKSEPVLSRKELEKRSSERRNIRLVNYCFWLYLFFNMGQFNLKIKWLKEINHNR